MNCGGDSVQSSEGMQVILQCLVTSSLLLNSFTMRVGYSLSG